MIQPSIEQTLKWDPARHAEILDVYEASRARPRAVRPAAVIWPETAATIFLRGDPACWIGFGGCRPSSGPRFWWGRSTGGSPPRRST